MNFLDGLEIHFCRRSDRERIAALEQQLALSQQENDMTKAKILALLAIIVALQHTEADDVTRIADLKQQVDDLKTKDADLNDPELVAAVDAVVGNAAATPPPAPSPAPTPDPAADAGATVAS